MTSWPSIEVDVLDDVDLDPGNVRLEMPTNAPQVDIMRDLFANEGALSLLEGIISVGYLTHETPIVVKRDGRNIVVEGNRRLAALKAIQNPFLVQEYQSRISSLLEGFDGRERLKVITVKRAPSQDEANQLIAAIHTGNIRRRWPPARQAAFFQAQVDSGKTLPDLLREYPTIPVRRFMLRSQILNKFKSVSYDDPEVRDYLFSRKVSVSTLARIYETAEFMQALGIKMKPDGSISLAVSDSKFKRIATYIVAEVKLGHLTTRTLNRKDSNEFKEVMKVINQVIASPSTRGTGGGGAGGATASREGNSGGCIGGGGGPQGRGGGQGNPPAGAAGGSGWPDGEAAGAGSASGAGTDQTGSGSGRTRSNKLDTRRLAVPSYFPLAIHKIFDELVDINVQKYPNATMDLLRTFLEKVIKAYATSISQTVPGRGGQAQLSEALTWLEAHLPTIDQRALVSVIKKIQSGSVRGYSTSATYLNDVNHNPEIFATSDDVHDLWTVMISLMRLMLK